MACSISAQEPVTIETEKPCTEPMELAAAELARYLVRVLGTPLPTVAIDGAPRIVIMAMFRLLYSIVFASGGAVGVGAASLPPAGGVRGSASIARFGREVWKSEWRI